MEGIMNGLTIDTQKLEEIAEEIKGLLTEAEFTARWGLIEAHHQVGNLILSVPGDRTRIVQELAVRIERSERTLWYDVKFAETYKDINKLPEGKVITWNKIIHKYLTISAEEKEHEHKWIEICSVCKERNKTDPV
jgi:hypothetical protein